MGIVIVGVVISIGIFLILCKIAISMDSSEQFKKIGIEDELQCEKTNRYKKNNKKGEKFEMKKDAGVAALLNAIVPGFGWLYCERIFLGIVSIIINIVLINILWTMSFKYYVHRDTILSYVVLAFCFWLFSVIYVFYNVKGFNLSYYFGGIDKNFSSKNNPKN